MSRIGKGAQEYRIDGAEDGRVRADPQCECCDRHRRESRVPHEAPEPVAGVADDLIDVPHMPRVAAVLLDQRERPQFAPGGAASLFGRHAAGHELVGASLHVEAQLVAELRIDAARPEQRAKPQAQLSGPAHGHTSCASTTSAMAAERRRQLTRS